MMMRAAMCVALGAVAGCGNSYRPVVSAFNPVGPANQPQKFAVAVSNPGPGLAGLVTIEDVFGDTILATPKIGQNPKYFVLNTTGFTGYAINGDGTVNTLGISASVQTSDVLQSTLLSGSAPNSIFAGPSFVYITTPGRNTVGVFQGAPPAFKQELPVGANPVYVVGASAAPRYYVVSQGANQVSSIDAANNTISNVIPVGQSPIYGVMSGDARRAFILNQGSGTVSVINTQTDQLDSTPTITVGQSPLWADVSYTNNELIVLNGGSGAGNGSVSIVSIPLCLPSSSASNPACSATNPVDAVGFGQVIATVPVGKSPRMVSVLQDGTRAYVANHDDGTVSVVNLTTNTVTATIPVVGHPIYLAATTGTPTGKVFVVSDNSTKMTVINTDTDTVAPNTIELQGLGVSVRVTSQ